MKTEESNLNASPLTCSLCNVQWHKRIESAIVVITVRLLIKGYILNLLINIIFQSQCIEMCVDTTHV